MQLGITAQTAHQITAQALLAWARECMRLEPKGAARGLGRDSIDRSSNPSDVFISLGLLFAMSTYGNGGHEHTYQEFPPRRVEGHRRQGMISDQVVAVHVSNLP